MSATTEQGRTTGAARSVALAAAGLAALTWVVATQVMGVELTVRSGGGSSRVGLPSVVVASLVAAVAGAALLRVLERRTPHALRWWTLVACGVWVLSLAGPLGATSAAAGAVLLLLHLLVGAVVVLGLRRTRLGRVA